VKLESIVSISIKQPKWKEEKFEGNYFSHRNLEFNILDIQDITGDIKRNVRYNSSTTGR